MYFPLFWAESNTDVINKKGNLSKMSRLGWSDISYQEAKLMADKRLSDSVDKYNLKQDILRDSVGRFYDGEDGKPIPEIVIKRLELNNEVVGVITRNRYGAECLNVEDVVILDVDASTYKKPKNFFVNIFLFSIIMSTIMLTFRAFKSLNFSPPINLIFLFILILAVYNLYSWFLLKIKEPDMRKKDDREKAEKELRNAILDHNKDYPEDTFSIYRTRKGHRLILCNKTINPAGIDRFKKIPSDPLYINLCLKQGGYRARLTPKPWNIKMPAMLKYKISDLPATESLRKLWVDEYYRNSEQKSVCELVEKAQANDEKISFILKIHDEKTMSGKGLY